MATLADSLKTSSSRPLALRKRPDLTAARQRYQGRDFWVVKEPIGLRYFRFHAEEYAILEMLDGRISLDEIKHRFENRFAPQKITFSELQQFIGTLHRNALVVASAPGQGVQLKQRRDERIRKERFGALTNVLSIRFKGYDPERLFNFLHPYIAWFFSPLAVTLCCLLGLLAASLVAVQFEVFQSRLPAFEEFFGPQNWLWLGMTLAIVKILHELGHGLSCKHFGGECHELGVMLLVLTPCLYCNVSDSWMLPSKWKRAAIGAAGMYVELVLASLATFIWWWSEPGMLNHLCLRVMFICSITTVLFNGNPLLRYDGYYILSDLIEIPNLRQKATSVLNHWLGQLCLGLDTPEPPFLPQRNRFFFGLYAVAAGLYRWVVVLSILWFLNEVFKPYGLQAIGQTVAAVSIASMIFKPLAQIYKFVRVPGRTQQVKRLNFSATVACVILLIVGILCIPIPRRVTCSLEIRPRQSRPVFVEVPGRLVDILVQPGQSVEAGEPLARLENLDLQLNLVELSGQKCEYQARLASLQQERFTDTRANGEIPQVKETLASIEQQLREKSGDLGRLNLVAPVAGIVLPPPSRTARKQPSDMLAEWVGSPLERKNLGAQLAQSDMLCEVGDPSQLEAVLVIDQSDIDLVSPGQTARLKLEAWPSEVLEGQITEIAKEELKVAPQSLSNQAGGDLATRTDSAGVAHPMSTSYVARVPLDDLDGQFRSGLRGLARVETGYQPLGGRIWRYLSHTFHFLL